MATLLLDAPPEDWVAPPGALLKVLLSPVRGADGQWRVLEQAIAAGVPVAEVLPAGQVWARLICSGRVLESDEYPTYHVQPNDEVLAIPQWGDPVVTPLLITLAVGIAVSIATTALSYLLFPPAKPHVQGGAIDEPTFSFEGIRTTIGPGQVVPVIYGRHRVGGQLLSASVDQARTVLDTLGPGGRQQVEALSTAPTLTMLLALGEGPIAQIDTASIEINGQPIANFPGVEVFGRLGTADQAPLPEFGETANTFSDGREIAGDPGITYTTTVPVDTFILNIAFQDGLYFLTEKGQKEDNVTTVQYRFRLSPSGPYTDWSTFDVAAARTSVVRFAIRWQATSRAVYDINVRFAGSRHTEELRAKWMATLESVTEILHNTNAYPNTALLGLRAVATDALQGALPNITVLVFGRTVRVASLSGPEVWSENAAWCLLDLMTHPRYGLGYPDAVMDFTAFYAWALYNDQVIEGEARHRFNYVLDREMRAQPLLMEIAGSARTILLKSEGLWTPRVTRDETPVQLLNWANVSNLVLTYSRDPDRINVMEGRFLNEDEGFASDVLTWPSVEHWPVEVRKASLDLRGITKASRVQRALQFELNRRRFEVLSLEMDCAPDALVLQVHDLFRFAHPLPGWGTSGRILPGSTTTTLLVDTPVTFEAGKAYHVYVRYQTNLMELRPVINPGPGPASVVALATPLSFAPIPYDCVWAWGESSPIDTAQRAFRVVRMARNADHSVHLQAIAHNPTLYDEPTAEPLPEITTLFNPLGPSPPLTSLVLMEVTRVEPSGASLRVVNISWDVAPLSRGFAPYGGALIQRRTVLTSTTGGLGEAGTQALGAALEAHSGNYLALTQVSGHVLDFDDYTVITGTTYDYRVIPVSQRGVPNNVGAREGRITVTGPTTPDFFPGTPLNLRLKGKTPLDHIFEGRNVDLEWDPPTGVLFHETFYLQDYLVEVWAPGQLYLLRRTTVPARTAGEVMSWTYTLEENTEDQAQAGYIGARRDLHFFVWARTNTNRVSLTPGQLLVSNPPPDMDDFLPVIVPIMEGGIVSFDQFVEPRDFDHYELHVDTVSPPLALYQDTVALGFKGPGISRRKIPLQGLLTGTTYYVYVMPYDTFGPGLATQIASFVAGGLTAESIDDTPPGTPTGLALTTGNVTGPDGSLLAWVQANWDTNPESDVASYQIYFRIPPSLIYTTFTVAHPTLSLRLNNVPGNVTIHAKMLAYDQFHNTSSFTPEVSITTAASSLSASQLDDGIMQVAVGIGVGNTLLLDGINGMIAVADQQTPTQVTRALLGRLGPLQTQYGLQLFNEFGVLMWNLSTGATPEGIQDNAITADKIQTAAIEAHHLVTDQAVITTSLQLPAGALAIIDDAHIKHLAVEKLLAGTINVAFSIGVSAGFGTNTTIHIDGVNQLLTVYDTQVPQRARIWLGRLGAGGSEYGLMIWNNVGQLMWDFNSGASSLGIQDLAVTNAKIANAAITNAKIGNLEVDNAKIANLTVGTGKIADNAVTVSIAYSQGEPIATSFSIETYVAGIGFPQLDAGDQLLFWASGSGSVPPGTNSMAIRIREDSLTGPEWCRADLGSDMNAPVFAQMVYNVPALVFNKEFFFTMQNITGLDSVTIRFIKFTALRRRK